jgi:hypothetical protein
MCLISAYTSSELEPYFGTPMKIRSIYMAVTTAIKNTGKCKYGIILSLTLTNIVTLLLAYISRAGH